VFDRDACHDLPAALAREWLETDGRGGYAALTSLFCPTRRQHGLLVAPYEGQPQRHVFLQRFEETLHVAGRAFPLSLARYPGLFSPHGHTTLERFTAVPWPESVHRMGDVTVTREVLLVPGTRAVLVRYRCTGAPGPVRLELRPLLPCRPADALTHENAALNPRSDTRADRVRWRPYPELPAVVATVGGAPWTFEAAPVWYRRVEYPADLARGYEGHEDTFCPGALSLTLAAGTAAVVAVALDETDGRRAGPGRRASHGAAHGAPLPDPVARFEQAARDRRAAWAASPDGLRGLLAYGADHYLARAPDGRPTVLAGYPWFLEWGRDTFLAVPGLCFARGRVEEGGDVLAGWLRLLDRGLFPNWFDPRGVPERNSVDAPLWFALAVRRYDEAGGDAARTRRTFLPALRAIVAAYAAGTPVGGEDDGGLVALPTPPGNVTWMDAQVDGEPVTPRSRCPVEIAALWVVARRTLADLEARFGTPGAAAHAAGLASRSGASFLARLWLPAARRLADGSTDGLPDEIRRPNALLAAARPEVPLTMAQRRDVVRAAEADLLTPWGLRSLAPDDVAYHPRYEGGPVARDRAYHQGTVWPWWLGAYVEASLLAFGRGRAVVARLRALLDGLAPVTATYGLGHLPEVFDGDPPHRPGGTFAQAFSDAEVLRAYALLDGPPGPAPGRRPSRRPR